MNSKQPQIPRNIILQFGVFFSFIFFNSILVAMRSVFVAAIFLLCYYSWNALSKLTLKI